MNQLCTQSRVVICNKSACSGQGFVGRKVIKQNGNTRESNKSGVGLGASHFAGKIEENKRIALGKALMFWFEAQLGNQEFQCLPLFLVFLRFAPLTTGIIPEVTKKSDAENSPAGC